jgi:hypothetical protein
MVMSEATDLLTRIELCAEIGTNETQLEYLRCRGLPNAGRKGRYTLFRLADVQAWLAEHWREKERRCADGAGAKWLTKQAARAQADQKGSKPCYSKAEAAGVARARAQTAEDEADTDSPGQHGGNHKTPMPAGSPTSWGAITEGTTLAGLSWWNACKTARPVR